MSDVPILKTWYGKHPARVVTVAQAASERYRVIYWTKLGIIEGRAVIVDSHPIGSHAYTADGLIGIIDRGIWRRDVAMRPHEWVVISD